MSETKPVYNWTEVMGSNMVYPTQQMIYQPVELVRNTRLKREGRTAPNRLIKVLHDKYFVIWRLENVLRDYDVTDEPKLREVFELVLMEINNRDNETDE